MKKKIGVIGAGRMGYQPAVDRAAAIGAEPSSVEQIGSSCGIILLSLPKPQHVRDVVGQLASVLPAGSIVADTSTVDPGTSQQNAELLKDTGAAYIDAPILGLPHSVGEWIMPLGGDSAAAEQLIPVLMSFCSKVVPVGGVGCGNAVKLLNNTMFAVINAISAEVMQMADKIGVDKSVFYDTVAHSKAATVSGLFKEVGKRICEERYDEPTFTLDLLLKDVNLGVQMARAAGMNPVIASTVLGLNENACLTGFGAGDCSGIYRYMDRLYKE